MRRVVPNRPTTVLAALTLALATAASAKPDVVPVKPGAPRPFEASDASRLLAQATFGPTLAEIERTRTLGARAWLDEQLAMPPTSHLAFIDGVGGKPAAPLDNVRLEAWLQRSLYAPDQLRQRVAFALSEVFVVSEQLPALTSQYDGLASYYDVLVDGAFGSYRDLLGRVARHPAMGIYLSMRGNRKADDDARIKPDENFARESMQLFATGLWMLEPDGTQRDGDPALAGVQPVPVYDQHDVRELARVYTGWNWPSCAAIPEARAAEWPGCAGAGEWRVAMAPTEWAHDRGEKRLLSHDGAGRGTPFVIAGGLDANAELDLALDHLAAHPNVGPFLSRQLIQRLVTSNPSPGYVERVARVFDDDGNGRRGDLGAVVRAILLDAEARDRRFVGRHAYGKLREPLLRYTHLLRALAAKSRTGRIAQWNPVGISQGPLQSPSVFNFFRPDYAPPGEIAASALVAPEFAISSEADVLRHANVLTRDVGSYEFILASLPDRSLVDLPREAEFARNAATLADRYSLLFMSGQMPPALRAEIIATVEPMPSSGVEALLDRARVAVTLVALSPAYAVQQ